MQAILRALFFTFLLGFMVVGGVAVSVLAEETSTPNAASAPAPEQAQETPAGKFIQDLGNQAITIIANTNLTQQQRSSKYRTLLQEAFDLKTIGHFVIGRTWDTISSDQQQEYMRLFEGLVLKTYGDRLSFYSGESFRVKNARQENDRDTVVNSEVLHPGGAAPTSIDWRVRQTDGKPLIVDVVIEGVSQTVTQRQEYSSIIQRDGGKIDGLLTLMRQRLQDNSSSNG